MRSKRVPDDMNFAVENDLADRRAIPDEIILQRSDILIKRLVSPNVMRRPVPLQEHIRQLVVGDEFMHLPQ